ncbi:hypothetical protein [Paenibacillus eucommiae]|uniref:Uncharacterized protein n=1 Tax=Paenibacillus eucommiae TaxID=1355755 RepID=A0ABS4IUA7_9BACL|nr:hypothetical protein [Paenibacillus eucommiae]MBP1991159.1 hypothetical protein [Paenibacillus eucommiae]
MIKEANTAAAASFCRNNEIETSSDNKRKVIKMESNGKGAAMLGNSGIVSGWFGLFGVLIYLFVIVIAIYCLVLFIRLAHRGIKALDIYIEEKKNQNYR